MDFAYSGPDIKQNGSSSIVTYNLGKARIHTYIAPEKSFGDATHIIETKNYLVLIDSQYVIEYAQDFRKYANSLNKPIAGIIISHAHPDHVFGLAAAFEDIPVYALKEVRDKLVKGRENMIKENKKFMGNLIADDIIIPQNILKVGTTEIDGIKYKYEKFINAESDVQLVIRLEELGVIIAQDLVYNGYHLWLGNHLNGWIKALQTLKTYPEKIILSGHGPPATPVIYNFLIRYLINAEKLIEFYKSKNNGDIMIQNQLIKLYPDLNGRELIKMSLIYMKK